jgi:hypothetical protein
MQHLQIQTALKQEKGELVLDNMKTTPEHCIFHTHCCENLISNKKEGKLKPGH